MKNIIYTAILTAGLLWQPFSASAQQDEKAEIARLRGQIRELEERNAFLKKALDLRAPSPLETTKDSIRIRLTRVHMDSDGERIHLRGMATYTGSGEVRIRIESVEIVDTQGNFYETFGIYHPNSSSSFYVDRPEPDLPYAFSVAFDNVKEKIPEAALIRIKINSDPLWSVTFEKKHIFNFKSVRVDWTKGETATAPKTTEATRRALNEGELMDRIINEASRIR